MRLFFGLPLDQHTSLAIDAFRANTLPPLDRPVPITNFHVTLAFLGEVPNNQMEELCELASGVFVTPFDLTLDELGYWPKPRILWLGASTPPTPLLQLVRDLAGIARRLRLPTDKRDYRAHVTIARNCQTPPPSSAMQPGITASFASFTLFQSTMTRRGVRYDPIENFG